MNNPAHLTTEGKGHFFIYKIIFLFRAVKKAEILI
jgi:hypothetical protein